MFKMRLKTVICIAVAVALSAVFCGSVLSFGSDSPAVSHSQTVTEAAKTLSAVGAPNEDFADGVHPFKIRENYGNGIKTVNANLIASGEHGNVWVLDHDSFVAAYPNEAEKATAECLKNFSEETADGIATAFDGIYERMTAEIAPHAGVVGTASFGNFKAFGDTDNDGKVNLLLYDIYGTSTAGFFTNVDFWTDYNELDVVHLDIGTNSNGGGTLLNGGDNGKMQFYGTIAHEFQHLLYYMYFGAYSENNDSWFNETLAGIAEMYFTGYADGGEVNPFFGHATDDYSDNGRDFFEYTTLKNYAMGYLCATVMQEKFDGFIGKIYDYFRNFLAVPTSVSEFNANNNKVTSSNLRAVLGDAFKAATGLGAGGMNSFGEFYFMFMEYFGADGGKIGADGETLMKLYDGDDAKPSSNLWAVRPAHMSMPSLSSGGAVKFSGGGTSVVAAGASREQFYRLDGALGLGELSITVPAGVPENTRFYVAVPNDERQIDGDEFWYSGENGATLYPLTKGEEKIIYTEGKDVFLYVVTLLQDVNTTVSFEFTPKKDAPAEEESGEEEKSEETVEPTDKTPNETPNEPSNGSIVGILVGVGFAVIIAAGIVIAVVISRKKAK